VKRVSYFVGGVAVGAAGISYVRRKVSHAANALAPNSVARRAAGGVRAQAQRTREALHEGAGAMRAKEAELRARRDGRVEVVDMGLEPGDRVLIDGRLVEPGKVVVLREEAERRRSDVAERGRVDSSRSRLGHIRRVL
jgi:hypothetical protein